MNRIMSSVILAAMVLVTSHAFAKEMKKGNLALLSYIKVKPGYEELFRKEILTIVDVSRAEPGNIAWFVQESQEDPQQFVFYTRWVNEEALDYHLKSSPLVSYLKKTAPFLAEPAKLVRFTPVDQ